MQGIRERGTPLAKFLGVKPYRGVLTGLNEAFLIDDDTRTALIRDDPGCTDISMMFRNDQRTRSPIKGKALREPGQSLSEQLEDLVYDRMLLWLLLPLLFGLLAGLEWWRWYREAPYNPLFYTVVAVLAALVSALRLVRLFRQARALLGRDGERVVGQFLEDMRPDGYHVLHDLIGDGFNVDHVVIGKGCSISMAERGLL